MTASFMHMCGDGRQVEHLITTHAEYVEIVPTHPDTRINPYEKLPLFKAHGWHPEGQSQ
jgi:hypothetical protein